MQFYMNRNLISFTYAYGEIKKITIESTLSYKLITDMAIYYLTRKF